MSSVLVMLLFALMGDPSLIASRQVSAPVPTATVMLRLTFPTGTWAKLGVPSGTRATVAVPDGPRFGLTATVTDDGRVDLVASDITTDPQTGSEVVQQLEHRVMELGDPIRIVYRTTTMTVTWLETRRVTGRAKDPGDPCKTCCVWCQGLLFCGCNVSTPCGDCCCSEYCACITVAGSASRGGPLSAVPGCGGSSVVR
jgi:hypothetical protein